MDQEAASIGHRSQQQPHRIIELFERARDMFFYRTHYASNTKQIDHPVPFVCNMDAGDSALSRAVLFIRHNDVAIAAALRAAHAGLNACNCIGVGRLRRVADVCHDGVHSNKLPINRPIAGRQTGCVSAGLRPGTSCWSGSRDSKKPA